MGAAQMSNNCSQQLSGLTACAPFVVPGGGNGGVPSGECCSALQSVAHDCVCTTLQIVSRLPSQCSLPPAACPAGP
ncbi:hypothetical protein H6P81_016498 [Aristolochia fimbriata]|uniref:Bifunctional inhibitor/plant lipid transfer protein/seed storage helical domain-containing protein n=1 Tax=Aristolochia fimbriata TaxID=158543 RepID=A0AAV7ED29_ARIFI|nr:hypothetical protein H6P81_016498 [Aristolochia fimbriata]